MSAQQASRPDGSEFGDHSVVTAYQHRPPIPEAILNQLHQLLPTSCRAVLDAGCGTGVAARALADHVNLVDAVDPSAEMISHGRQVTSSANITWITAPMETAELHPPYGLIVSPEACTGWIST